MNKEIRGKIIEILEEELRKTPKRALRKEEKPFTIRASSEILELFSEEKGKWIEEILEKLPKEKKDLGEKILRHEILGVEYGKGYNQAIQEIKSIIARK